jgi:hypothetical protein
MKVGKYIALSAFAAAIIGFAGCGSDSDNSSSATVSYVAASPTAPDSYEGTNGDNNMSTAGTIAVGSALQGRSIYPHGDVDWVKVQLQAGTVYELFTTNLNEVGDTYLYLLDENGTELDSSDDHLYLDSDIEEYNATYTGTHYLKLRSYNVGELTSYQLGVRVHIDADNDGYTPTFDCNDNNDTIYATATEIPGDGIDQDCSGVDAIADGLADPYEADDDLATAKPIAVTTGSTGETQHRNDVYSKMHTLHTTSDTDFFTLTIPAYSGAYIVEGNGLNYEWYGYDENGTQGDFGSSDMYETVINDTATAQTFKLEIRSNGSDIGWYAPAMVPFGTDADGDGYYTMDWNADCDDTNALINPGESDDNSTDGIDSNCDGIDGVNLNYQS